MIEYTPPPGLTLESLDAQADTIFAVCRVPDPPGGWPCPTCGAIGQKYGGLTRTLHDLPIGDRRVVIHWYQPRVRCRPCRKTWWPTIAAVSDDHPKLSARLVARAAELLREGQGIKATARALLLSATSVRNVAISQGIELARPGRPRLIR